MVDQVPTSIVRVMTTPVDNDGKPQPHPADYHAEITAEKLIMVAETASADVKRAGRELRKKVEAILLGHHSKVHAAEQSALQQHGMAHAEKEELESADHVDDEILNEIVAASRGTILQEHFAREDVQQVILNELHHETRSQMFVHRAVHRTHDQMSRKPKLVS